MKDPDFVYGIVPALGEYGFETQPSDVDTKLSTRVQELTSSFEWTGLVTSNPVAIALDPAEPILVARYATDPRDPEGRISLSMNVWIADDESDASRLIDELWPRQETCVNKQQFWDSSGRRVAGPEKSFVATGFENAWGAQTTKKGLTTNRSQITRPVASSDSRSTKKSSPVLKAFATVVAVLCCGLAGSCFYLYQENNRNNTDAVRYSRKLNDAEEHNREQKGKHTDEINSLNQKIKSLGSTKKDLEAKVTRLEKVIASDTHKVDRVEFENLRELSEALKEFIDATDGPFDRLKQAVNEK